MSQLVQMTAEQLQQLIESVRAATEACVLAIHDTKTKGSFTNCYKYYDGERDQEELEEFIANIETYKELEGISDEDALKSMSLLLYGFAAIWWQGIHKEAKTWNDALRLLREHFSPAKTAAQIYKEIFEKKQDEKAAMATFVCQKRALLAQLPEGRHDEETEIDLIYELLHIKYRKRIARSDIKSFHELLERARMIERNMVEDEAYENDLKTKLCTYCNYRGHTTEECRLRKTDRGGD